MEAVASLPNLMDLSLWNTSVTTAGLAHLAELKSLRRLDLNFNPQIQGDPCIPLGQIGSLQELTINGSPAVLDKLEDLGQLPRLRSLYLDGVQFTPHALTQFDTFAPMASLHSSKRLTHLTVDNSNVTDEAVRAIAWLDTLETLNLAGTQITDAALADIAKLQNLRFLSLNDTNVTDAGMAELVNMTSLLSLDIGDTSIGEAGVMQLAVLQNLQILTVDTRVSLPFARQFRAGLPDLKIRAGDYDDPNHYEIGPNINVVPKSQP